MKDFEVGAVGFESEGGSLVCEGVLSSFFGGEVKSTVPYGAVKTAVGSEDEAIEVVAGKGDADSKAVLENDFFRIGNLAIAVEVREGPDVWDTGEEEDAVVCKNSSCGSI